MDVKQLDELITSWFPKKIIGIEEEVPYPLQTHERDADYVVSIITGNKILTLAINTVRETAAYYKFENQTMSDVTVIDPSENGSSLYVRLNNLFAEKFATDIL
jgi:hypothetical protein